jgi:hypothetical protein
MGSDEESEEPMIRILRVLVLVTAVLALCATTAIAYAGTNGNSLMFTEHDTYFHVTDIAPPGPSTGDVYIVRGKLLQDGEQIGALKAVCTLVGHSGRASCDITFRFGPFSPDADRLYLQGWYNPVHPSSTFAVVGGSNGYAGASGTGVRTTIDGTNASWDVELN